MVICFVGFALKNHKELYVERIFNFFLFHTLWSSRDKRKTIKLINAINKRIYKKNYIFISIHPKPFVL